MAGGLRSHYVAPVSYTLIIRPEAEADLTDQFDWYDQCKKGLGHEFLAEIHSSVRQIAENPLRNAMIYKSARRALVRRFPFQVVYLVEDETVEVIAFMHARRDPQRWRGRVP